MRPLGGGFLVDFFGEGVYLVMANKELDYEDTFNTQVEGNCMPGFPKRRPEVMALATAIEAEATLAGQPCGAELEYRVIAGNKAGDGPRSNWVMEVL